MSDNTNKAATVLLGDAGTGATAAPTTSASSEVAIDGGKYYRFHAVGGNVYLSANATGSVTNPAVTGAASVNKVPDGEERDFFVPWCRNGTSFKHIATATCVLNYGPVSP